MDSINLAKTLKKLRTLRGMSQEYLAEESRVSLRTIQRIENNESVPMGETIKRISAALEVEVSELIGSELIRQTNDLSGTIIFLKMKLSKTTDKSEIKTFKNFIKILNSLKEKDLSKEHLNGIEHYITYLELEKIPSFSNEIFKVKLAKFKKFLKNKLRFVPINYYAIHIAYFAVAFACGFIVQVKVPMMTRIIVAIAFLSLIGIGIIMDLRIKKQERSFSF